MSSPIAGGAESSAFSHAVAICLGDAPGTCTFQCSASLIAPNLVLTVRHCLYPVEARVVDCSKDLFGAEPTVAPGKVWVTTDPKLTVGGRWHQASEIRAPLPRALCGADLSVVFLANSVPAAEAAPATPLLQTLPTKQDSSIAVVGYGETKPDGFDFGIRRARERVPITCVAGDAARPCGAQFGSVSNTKEFVAEAGGCEGDSGAGALDQVALDERTAERPFGAPVLLGVLARGASKDGVCGKSIYTRLDAWGSFIAAAGRDASIRGGYPEPQWIASATPKTNRFPPRSMGADCNQNSDCDSDQCASNDTGFSFVCTQTCQVDIPTSCPTDFTCERFKNEEQRCFYRPKVESPKESGTCSFSSARADDSSARGLGTIGAFGLLTVLFIIRGIVRRESRDNVGLGD